MGCPAETCTTAVQCERSRTDTETAPGPVTLSGTPPSTPPRSWVGQASSGESPGRLDMPELSLGVVRRCQGRPLCLSVQTVENDLNYEQHAV